MKLLDWVLYIIGALFVTIFLHELYHLAWCHKELYNIAYVGIVYNFNLIGSLDVGGAVYCRGNYGGEFIPSFVEMCLFVGLVYAKIRLK